MTIQRQYSLPNCKLVVEGLADDAANPAVPGRPLLSIVTHAECHIVGHTTPLSGGRAFLESLIASVSHYAQEFLSDVPHPQTSTSNLVHLDRISPDVHRLTLQPESGNGESAPGSEPMHVDLKTVQLFDLVEAIDQLSADTQTLPDLTLTLAPVSRRYAITHEPIAKRAVPAAIGIASLATVAIALAFLPVPERRPESPSSGAEPSPTATSPTPSASASPTPNPSPVDTATPSASETPAATSATPSPEGDVSEGEAIAPPPDSDAITMLLSTAPEINDPDVLSDLKTQLRDRLDEAWSETPEFEEPLVYRVAVAENGDILGFKYTDEASVKEVDQTPLPDLRYNLTDDADQEPVGQFRVVFTPNGVIEVSPWFGTPRE